MTINLTSLATSLIYKPINSAKLFDLNVMFWYKIKRKTILNIKITI